MMQMTRSDDRLAVWLIAILMLLLAVPSAALAAEQRSMVRCTPLEMPARAPAPGRRPVLRIGDGRFFAPTRQAMFFSRPGDRCVWHAAAIARG